MNTKNMKRFGHNWLADYFPPIENSRIFMINSMLNHVAILKPRKEGAFLPEDRRFGERD